MLGTKIATCCYCGSRAALVLKGQVRHELACSTCGAPLSRLKSLPRARPAAAPGPTAAAMRPTPPRQAPKRKKSVKRKLASQLWDIVEEIFD